MTRRIALFVLTLAAACFGCHAQMPPQPPVYSCPVTTGSAYTVLNQPASNTVPASITGTTYTTPALPTPGPYCFIVQSWAEPSGATTYQVSLPSNVVMVITTTADPAVALSWTAPTGATGYTYIASYAAATLVPPPTAPVLSAPTAVTHVERPALAPTEPQMASVAAPLGLVGRAR